jgi:hypothetical protein
LAAASISSMDAMISSKSAPPRRSWKPYWRNLAGANRACWDWLDSERLRLFRYVQASELACLPDRSYRCRFPRMGAEAFTTEQNVRRCLRTHRICSPPDYRQLAARGLSPREIHSIVDCSTSELPHVGVNCFRFWHGNL